VLVVRIGVLPPTCTGALVPRPGLPAAEVCCRGRKLLRWMDRIVAWIAGGLSNGPTERGGGEAQRRFTTLRIDPILEYHRR
jgi:hypothetical protein